MQPDGTQKQVDVVVGLKGNTTTEITGAVKAGDVVALPATTVADEHEQQHDATARASPAAARSGRRAAVFGGGGFGGPRG